MIGGSVEFGSSTFLGWPIKCEKVFEYNLYTNNYRFAIFYGKSFPSAMFSPLFTKFAKFPTKPSYYYHSSPFKSECFESIPAFGVKIAFLKSFDRFENNEKKYYLSFTIFDLMEIFT